MNIPVLEGVLAVRGRVGLLDEGGEGVVVRPQHVLQVCVPKLLVGVEVLKGRVHLFFNRLAHPLSPRYFMIPNFVRKSATPGYTRFI